MLDPKLLEKKNKLKPILIKSLSEQYSIRSKLISSACIAVSVWVIIYVQAMDKIRVKISCSGMVGSREVVLTKYILNTTCLCFSKHLKILEFHISQNINYITQHTIKKYSTTNLLMLG